MNNLANPFHLNGEKAFEVVKYLMAKQPSGIRVYVLEKMIYLADRLHLKRHARTIYGETYRKDPNGPVPVTASSLIAERDFRTHDDGQQYVPGDPEKSRLVSTHRDASSLKFSETDMQCLDETFNTYKDYGYDDFIKLTHDDPAYMKAEEGGNLSVADIIDTFGAEGEVIKDYLLSD